MGIELSGNDTRLLQAAFQVASRAVESGNHPFGAILADEHGEILLEAQNTAVTGNDPTGHAETNLIRMAWQSGYAESLANMTIYASTEPCPMCAGAIYWGNIGRVVYGLSQERLYSIINDEGGGEGLVLSCRELLSHGARLIEVIGPALEDEAAEAHEGFWEVK
jgi:tRNA(Arg) A34 adenosine deaminase TadA